jgi:quercetin dioxygenase-like cupin family protein
MHQQKQGGVMPILDKNEADVSERYPGVHRWQVVDGDKGADGLSVGHLVFDPESTVPNHVHPTEEAMVLLDGELEAVLGDEVRPVTAGQTVLAPAGVKHGFVNRSGKEATLMAIFPTPEVEITLVE